MTDRPRINVDFRTHWCTRHLEPFREDWPGGAGLAMVRLIEAVLVDDRITAAVPKRSDGSVKMESFDAVLIEHSPLCCFVGEERMREIYEAAGKKPPL